MILMETMRPWWCFEIEEGKKAKAFRKFLPAGKHHMERRLLPAPSGLNRDTTVALGSALRLSRRRMIMWLMVEGTNIGAPEKFWRRWQNQDNNGFDGSDEPLTDWGDYEVSIEES